jgi:hypothetical protein
MARSLLGVALLLLGASEALYQPRDGVPVLTEAEFKREVLDFDGVVAVEFFAPW